VTIQDRLRQLASLLPSDESAITLTKADILSLVGEPPRVNRPVPERDLTVDEVADETHRAPSTVRGWLIAGELNGYKLNRRDWRIPRSALQAYINGQSTPIGDMPPAVMTPNVDITAWRRVRP
jgi:excisionase family DNA binding protein